jgi:hypothetical protein
MGGPVRGVPVPAYRLRCGGRDGPPWRMIIMAGSALAVGAAIAASAWGFVRESSLNAPLVEADARPIKMRPDNPGGLRVPNQDVVIFEGARRTRPAERSGLAPDIENPRVDQLRSFISR